MKMSYVEIIQWLDRFPIGKLAAHICKSTIGVETEPVILSKVNDREGIQISFTAFYGKRLIKCDMLSHQSDLSDVTTNIETYSLDEIIKTEFAFSEPKLNQFSMQMNYTHADCNLEFSNGSKLAISSKDYDDTIDEFIVKTAQLIKK